MTDLSPQETRAREVKQYNKLIRIAPDRTDGELMHLLACTADELDEIKCQALQS